MFLLRCFVFTLIVSLVGSSLAQVTIIDDDLNVDSSADYTVVNGGLGAGDGTLTFAFDYSTLLGFDGNPIVPAPSTTDGSTTGVQVTVNDTAPAGEEAYTIFHNTEITNVTDYTMTVDVYLGIWSTSPDTGSTEHVHIGVAGDGATLNQAFQAADGSLQGSGNFVFISGDGGDSSDYRHWRDDANGSGAPAPVNQFDPDYLSPDSGTNVTGDNFPFFEGISNFNAPFPGSIGDGWATIKVEVSQTDGRLRYYVRGADDETTGDPFSPAPPEFVQIIDSPLFDTDGFVSFGLGDLYSSVATDPVNQFAIFDNLLVEGSSLPTGGMVDGDFNDDMNWDCADVDALVAEIVAGTNTASFDINGDTIVDDADLAEWLVEGGANNSAVTGGNPFLGADANLDGTVDVSDFNIWNGSKFSAIPAFCSGDFNADGSVDVSDFNIWNGLKFSSSDSVSVVPEPESMPMVLVGLVGFLAILRRNR